MDYQNDQGNAAVTYLPLEARSPDAPNGAPAVPVVAPSPPAAPTGPVIGKRTEWFPKDKDHSEQANNFRAAYPGFAFRLWVNFPQKYAVDLNAGMDDKDENERRMRHALKQIVLEHNGWQIMDDETGETSLLPSPSSDLFWDKIPTELAASIFIVISGVSGDLPFSMIQQRRNSRRG